MRSFPADTNGGYDKKRTKRVPNYPPINTHDQSPKITDNQTADHPGAIAIYSKRINIPFTYHLRNQAFYLTGFYSQGHWTLVHLYLGTSGRWYIYRSKSGNRVGWSG